MRKFIATTIIVLATVFTCSKLSGAQVLQNVKDDNLGRGINLIKKDLSEGSFSTNLVLDQKKLQESVVERRIDINSTDTLTIYEKSVSAYDRTYRDSFYTNIDLEIPLIAKESIYMNFMSEEKSNDYYYKSLYSDFSSYRTYQTYLENPNYDEDNKYSNCVTTVFRDAVNNAHIKFVNSNDISAYFSIFNNFGTHILTKANYGSQVNVNALIMTNDSETNNLSVSTIKSSLEYTFGQPVTSMVSGNVATDTKSVHATEENIKLSKAYAKFNTSSDGVGSSYYTFRNDYAQWEKNASNDKNSALISSKDNEFVPIWQYLNWSNNSSQISKEFEVSFKAYSNTFNFDEYEFSNNFSFSHPDQHKITDSGRWNNHIQLFLFDDKFNHGILNDEKTYITVRGSFNFKEKDSGYQYVFLYNTNEKKKAKIIKEFSDFPNASKDGFNNATFEYKFSAEKLEGTNSIAVLFGADGKYDDDWWVKGLVLSVTVERIN